MRNNLVMSVYFQKVDVVTAIFKVRDESVLGRLLPSRASRVWRTVRGREVRSCKGSVPVPLLLCE